MRLATGVLQVMRVFTRLLLGLLISYGAWARDLPSVSIIIDDLGYRLSEGKQAIQLPGPLAYAVIPFTPHGRQLAELAHHSGKEVMLHAPMQSVEGQAPSKGELEIDMQKQELMAALHAGLDAVPHAIGVNNHQGSLLTRHPGHMAWVMTAMRGRGGLFFVDSRTTKLSVAEQVAQEYGVPVLRRDVFLDHQANEDYIRGQVDQLIRVAQYRGYAVAIGHPYPETLKVLHEVLPHLTERGVRLVPISEQIQQHGSQPLRLTAVQAKPSPTADAEPPCPDHC